MKDVTYITLKELAKRYRVSTRTAYRWVKQGKVVPAVRIGKKYLFI